LALEFGYPGARPVTLLKDYILRNQIESDHHYSAYPGASVTDVRAALHVDRCLARFAAHGPHLQPEQFTPEFMRFLFAVQNDLGTVGTVAKEAEV
jgi:hypothetical protein